MQNVEMISPFTLHSSFCTLHFPSMPFAQLSPLGLRRFRLGVFQMLGPRENHEQQQQKRRPHAKERVIPKTDRKKSADERIGFGPIPEILVDYKKDESEKQEDPFHGD
jgi:hypothetical protein